MLQQRSFGNQVNSAAQSTPAGARKNALLAEKGVGRVPGSSKNGGNTADTSAAAAAAAASGLKAGHVSLRKQAMRLPGTPAMKGLAPSASATTAKKPRKIAVYQEEDDGGAATTIASQAHVAAMGEVPDMEYMPPNTLHLVDEDLELPVSPLMSAAELADAAGVGGCGLDAATLATGADFGADETFITSCSDDSEERAMGLGLRQSGSSSSYGDAAFLDFAEDDLMTHGGGGAADLFDLEADRFD